MNGLLDPQTPIGLAELAADRLTAAHPTFVAVPWSPHVVTFESPVKTADAAPCGTQLMAKFIADPEAPVDTTCLDNEEKRAPAGDRARRPLQLLGGSRHPRRCDSVWHSLV
ncbi:hypothetical protein [Sorangium sp. So ce1335]|uniref:hypothetical protein n=1 Tax=Sorangium sp. So ce1335 TaxID=3133335 RepID=UPI003F62C379